jgi:hypothetical protein
VLKYSGNLTVRFLKIYTNMNVTTHKFNRHNIEPAVLQWACLYRIYNKQMRMELDLGLVQIYLISSRNLVHVYAA